MNSESIFLIRNKNGFEKKALEIFRFQADKNPVYKKFVEQLGVNAGTVKTIAQIPFLPIEFFKTQKIMTGGSMELGDASKNISSSFLTPHSSLFLSSGTTGMERSKHYVSDVTLYEKSFQKCFKIFYGDVKQYAILALLPSYYENKNSSLMYMVMDLIRRSNNKYSSFYNSKDENILQLLQTLIHKKQKTILFGVSFALLDLPPLSLSAKKDGIRIPSEGRGVGGEVAVIETGGMKGRREEITREELHKALCSKFGVKKIHSEYGMTELLSQAYSKGDGIFHSPPWMKVMVRDINDPFTFLSPGKSGALNIIDLANINSCAFIATQDVGRIHKNGTFEVLGRMDNSDLRGCNLLAT